MMFIYLFLVQHNLQQEKEIKANKMMLNNLVVILLPPRSQASHDAKRRKKDGDNQLPLMSQVFQ